jgi:proteasome lid subunit RPN8/RPN11
MTRIPPFSDENALKHLGIPTGAADAHSKGLHPEALPLRWSQATQVVLESHCMEAYPGEGCGFLLGLDGPDERRIHVALETENRAGQGELRRFSMTPLDFMQAERLAAGEGLEVLGIFHSHPDHRAIPSAHDLHGALPHLSYVILSVDGKSSAPRVIETRSWQLDADLRFSEEVIQDFK